MFRVKPAVAVAAIVCVLAGFSASAQSPLADAARAAEDQRRSQTVPSLEIKDAPGSTFGELALTDTLFARFSNARSALQRLYGRDRVVYETVRGGAAAVRRFHDFVDVLASERKIVESLGFFGFDPDGFVTTEVTLRRSLGRVGRRLSGGNDVERRNDAFVQSHPQIRFTYNSWKQLDQGRAFWPENAFFW